MCCKVSYFNCLSLWDDDAAAEGRDLRMVPLPHYGVGLGLSPLENVLVQICTFWCLWRRLSNFGGNKILVPQYFLLGAPLPLGSTPI